MLTVGLIKSLLSAMLAFGLGAYAGTTSKSSNEVPIERQGPDRFTKDEQKELIRECRISCGKNRFKKYDMIYGECECVDVK